MNTNATTSSQTATGTNASQDLELRAPLPPDHCTPEYDNIMLVQKLRPMLYRMFVACRVLRIGNEARFTAVVLLHRYAAANFKSRQFNQAPIEGDRKIYEETEEDHWKWVAAACLVLACKSEEEPRRLRDVINVAWMLRFGSDQKIGTNKGGLEQHQQIGKNKEHADWYELDVLEEPPALDEGYWEAKERLVATEQAVLRMIQFDVLVSHPHRVVVLLAEEVSSDPLLRKMAWRRLNDALFHPRALQHPVLPLACAALCLAMQDTHISASDDTADDNGNGNTEYDVATKLGLTQFWSDSYKISAEALAAAKTSLVEATTSMTDINI